MTQVEVIDICMTPGRKFGTNIHRQLQFNSIKSEWILGFVLQIRLLLQPIEEKKRSGDKLFAINVVLSYKKKSNSF